MALKPCRECGREVSTSASKCPHCGKPNPTQQLTLGVGCLLIVVVLMVIGLLSSLFDDEATPSRRNTHPSGSARIMPPLTAQDGLGEPLALEGDTGVCEVGHPARDCPSPGDSGVL